jgi:hypothetical protein
MAMAALSSFVREARGVVLRNIESVSAQVVAKGNIRAEA